MVHLIQLVSPHTGPLGAFLTLAAAFSLGRALTSWRSLPPAIALGTGAARPELSNLLSTALGHGGSEGDARPRPRRSGAIILVRPGHPRMAAAPQLVT